jgi:hypothetical protein
MAPAARAVGAAACAAVFLIAGAGPVQAHDPVQGAVREYSQDLLNLTYKFASTSYPSYVTTAFDAALQTRWDVNNNSDAPRFDKSSTGSGRARYATSTGVPACDNLANWLGCASGGGTTSWNIWLRKDLFTFCELNDVTGCFRAKRVILHEAEHVTLGVLNHDPQDGTVTNMGGCPGSTACSKAHPGWDSNNPKECDQASLQLNYGLKSVTGSYADCLDHVPNAGSSGLATDQTVSSSTGTTCIGLNLTRSGRISTESHASYGELSNLGIAGREILIDRKLDSSSTWNTGWSSVTTTSAQTGNNWSYSFSENVANTYDYRIRLVAEDGLSSSSKIITLTFFAPCPPP